MDSNHSCDEGVNELLSVSVSTISLSKWVSLELESTEWWAELEWPQEVVTSLEVWSACDDFVNETLNASDSTSDISVLVLGAEFIGDDAVVSEWNSASVDFTIASLVDELPDGFSWWVAEGDKWFNHSDHVPGCFVKLHKYTVVQLSQSKELQDLLWLWGKLVDTK